MAGMLDRLASIPGVSACAIFNLAGECVAEEIKPPYESILFTTAGNQLREAWDLFEFLDSSKPEMIVGRFEFGCLAARRISGHVIIIVADATVNMAMLNVGMNVAVLRLAEEGSGAGSSSGHAPHSGGGTASKQYSRPSMGGQSQGSHDPTPSAASRVSSQVSVLSWTSPSGGGTLVIPPDAVGEQVIGELVTLLAKFVGPFAKVMVKEELKALGAHPRTLRRAAWRDLLDAIMRGIPQQEKREAFITEARRLLPE